MPRASTLAHLAQLYAASGDPWGHDTRDYERRKYRATLAALGRRRFRLGLEIGCGTGALLELAAPRCDRLIGMECIEAAARRARTRVAALPHVEVLRGIAPAQLPAVRPDLVILSEVLYYLQDLEVDALADWARVHLRAGGAVVCVNWTGPTGEALSGRAAVRRFRARLRPRGRQRHRGPGYVIDRFEVRGVAPLTSRPRRRGRRGSGVARHGRRSRRSRPPPCAR